MTDTPSAGGRRIRAIVARSLKGEASAAEAEAVRAWRRESPEHEAEYRELARLVELSARLPELVDAGPRPSAAELIARADERPRVFRLRRRLLRRGRRWTAAAAAVAAAAAFVFLGTRLDGLRRGEGASPPFGVREIATSDGETATLELVDGTVVKLAPNSRLRLIGGRSGREVVLDGRSFFAVAEQDGLPFVIRTAAGNVTVLGTRFDVEARAQQLQLLVVEGRVALSTEQERTEVAAGELGRIVDGQAASVVDVPEIGSFVDWTGDFLAFQSTALRSAAREIERVYDIRVEIEAPELASRVITAWFADASLEHVIDVVCLAVAARCTIEDDVVRVRPQAASTGGTAPDAPKFAA